MKAQEKRSETALAKSSSTAQQQSTRRLIETLPCTLKGVIDCHRRWL